MNTLSKTCPSLGFSFIELVIVMTLYSMLAAFGSYSLTQWQHRQQVRSNAQQLALFLNRVRQQAYAYQRDMPLWIGQKGGHWCLGAGKPRGQCRDKQWHWYAGPKIESLTIIGEPGFYGKHNTAWPGSIEIGLGSIRWRVILSNHGRIRYCESQNKECL